MSTTSEIKKYTLSDLGALLNAGECHAVRDETHRRHSIIVKKLAKLQAEAAAIATLLKKSREFC